MESMRNVGMYDSGDLYGRKERSGKCRQRFIDISSTGMRLRYLEYPSREGSESEVVLLLHGAGQSAEIWSQIASALYERGYYVFCLDLRGHGGSSHSSDGRYNIEIMAEDVRGFILEKDLYTRPVALVGNGIGGAVAIQLAAHNPMLVGALACIEFSLPEQCFSSDKTFVSQVAEELKIDDSSGLRISDIAPWWSFWFGQAAKFESVEECGAFLGSPLINVGPKTMTILSKGIQGSTDTESKPLTSPEEKRPTNAGPEGQQQYNTSNDTKKIMSSLARPLSRTMAEAKSLLKQTSRGISRSALYYDDFVSMEQRMDPKFFFNFDLKPFLLSLRSLKHYFLVIYGGKSEMISEGSAQLLAKWPTDCYYHEAISISQGSHTVVSDESRDVTRRIIDFLEGPAARCFMVNKEEIKAGSRLPEKLQLRPLPEYNSVEEAKKALGPRKLPTTEAIEEELKRLRMENGMDPDGADSDDDSKIVNSKNTDSTRQTALAKDPPNYFGFVG